jgi:hypothetical protein
MRLGVGNEGYYPGMWAKGSFGILEIAFGILEIAFMLWRMY